MRMPSLLTYIYYRFKRRRSVSSRSSARVKTDAGFPGTIVTIVGLQKRTDLNGATGIVLGDANAETGRHPVRIGDEWLLIRSENIRASADPSAAGDASVTPAPRRPPPCSRSGSATWLGVLLDDELEEGPALQHAARTCDMQLLRRLLGRTDCDVEATELGGPRALEVAAEHGHLDVVLALLDHGASVTAPSRKYRRTPFEGWTVLHAAAQSASTETVALLLARGAALTATTAHGVSALHVAAFHGRLGATKLLLARRADPLVLDAQGRLPLDHARYYGDGCSCQASDRTRQWSAVVALLERIGPMGAAERHAATARSWALVVSSQLQEAVERRPEPPQRPARRQRRQPLPPSTRAAADDEGLGDPASRDALATLLACYGGQSPAALASDVDAADFDGSTALHAAALGGHTEAARRLLEHGATVNAMTHCADSPLHFAAGEGHVPMVRLLLAWRADLHRRTRHGVTPLQTARRRRTRKCEAVAALLEEAEDKCN